jgi:hypothetical protein
MKAYDGLLGRWLAQQTDSITAMCGRRERKVPAPRHRISVIETKKKDWSQLTDDVAIAPPMLIWGSANNNR